MDELDEMLDEEFMEELKHEFIQRLIDEFTKTPDFLKKNDYREIRRIAHDIKGTAGTFGYDEGSEIAKELQYASENKEKEKVEKLIKKLNDYFKEQGIELL